MDKRRFGLEKRHVVVVDDCFGFAGGFFGLSAALRMGKGRLMLGILPCKWHDHEVAWNLIRIFLLFDLFVKITIYLAAALR